MAPNAKTLVYFDNANRVPAPQGINLPFNQEGLDIWIGYDEITGQLCMTNFNRTTILACYAPGDGTLVSEVTLLPADILVLAQNVDTTPEGDFFELVPAPSTPGQAIIPVDIGIRTTSGVAYVVPGAINIFEKQANVGGFTFNFNQSTTGGVTTFGGLGVAPATFFAGFLNAPIPTDPADKAAIVANKSLKIGRGTLAAITAGNKSMIITIRYKLVQI